MTQVQLTTSKNGWVRSSADWLETHPLTTLVIVAAAYFAVTSYLARLKPLWSDEFYTLYIAKAGFKGAWEILLTGADQHPPTFYWLTNICLQLFRFGPAILRLPELIAFWIMLLCLFLVIARKTSNLIAYFAMVLPCLTPIYAYAFEARGYGLLLGAAAAGYFFLGGSIVTTVSTDFGAFVCIIQRRSCLQSLLWHLDYDSICYRRDY
jgi:Dolichyl-phosphate-mannose-protein mannosyltransferase